MEEREIKLPVLELDSVRRRLIELGAECEAEASRERNSIFDRGNEIYGAGKALRLRIDGRGARLTFKGPARYEAGVKVRQELETGVENAVAMREILEALGYRRVSGYEKEREEWRLGEALIALDHTPIGDFIEIEHSDPAAVAGELGLDAETSESRSYLSLYRDYRRPHPNAPPEMSFL